MLYTLLPPIEGGYLRILGVFMLAFVVAVLTHVPGGYGVFDALIVHFLPRQGAVGGGGAVGVPRDLLLGAAVDCRGDAGLPRVDVGQRRERPSR